MSVTPVELAKAVSQSLGDELAGMAPDMVISRRYRPRKDRSEFIDDRLYITVYMETVHALERLGREVDRSTWGIGIVIQQAVPTGALDGDGQAVEDGNDNLAFGDLMLGYQQRVEHLWAMDEQGNAGVLRRRELAGCQFFELLDQPLFEAEHLLHEGVFTSVIMPVYRKSSDDGDE